MARLIYAEFIEKYVNREEHNTPDERWRPESEFVAFIDNAPTVDAAEVVHGEWLYAYEYALKIGVTDEERLEEVKKDKWWKFCNNCEQQVKGVRNYCSNCGTKMDGGDKE